MKSDNLDTRKLAKAASEDDIKDSNTKRICLLRRTLKISLILGCTLWFLIVIIAYFTPNLPKKNLLVFFFAPTVLFFFLVATTLGIAIKINSLRSKMALSKFNAITSVVFRSILLTVLTTIFLRLVLPFVYTPPAITPESLSVFNKCIEFVKNHDRYKNLTLSRWRYVSISGDRTYLLHSSSPWDKTDEFFSESEFAEMKILAKQLHSIRCQRFRRDNDIVLFYRTLTPIPPMPETPYGLLPYLPRVAYAVLRILPSGPGVAYSLHGKNPNEIDSDVLNAAKPFIHISSNWYLSRHLMFEGFASSMPASIPKSLIDHSSRIKCLKLDEPHTTNQSTKQKGNSEIKKDWEQI